MFGFSLQDPVVQADLKLWPFKVRVCELATSTTTLCTMVSDLWSSRFFDRDPYVCFNYYLFSSHVLNYNASAGEEMPAPLVWYPSFPDFSFYFQISTLSQLRIVGYPPFLAQFSPGARVH